MIREFCFMMIFERDIAIDIGTTNIRVFVRGKGIMLREPSIVAVDKYTGRMLKFFVQNVFPALLAMTAPVF